MIFKKQRKKTDSPIKIELNRKKLYSSKSVKYLGIKIDENLNWKQKIRHIAIKLNRTICSYHVTLAFQSESTLYSCLNVEELLTREQARYLKFK